LAAGVVAGGVGAAPNSTEFVKARDYCYQQAYDEAAALVEELVRDDASGPAGLFWQAALTQMLLYDSGNPVLIDSFYRLSDRAVARCRAALRQNPNDAWALFYLGMTQLNRANCLGWQRRRLSAFRTLVTIPASLQKAVRIDTTLEDAWFGLGVIEYFKAVADRYCFGLGLIGSRARAYKLVRRAVANGGLLQPAAEFLLGFMAKEDGNYEAATACCQRLLERYPGNRAARRMLRDIYIDMGEYEKALAVAAELERDIQRAFPENRYGLAENWIKMASAWAQLGDSARTCCLADRVIAWEPFQDQVPWLDGYVRDAKRLKRRWYHRQ